MVSAAARCQFWSAAAFRWSKTNRRRRGAGLLGGQKNFLKIPENTSIYSLNFLMTFCVWGVGHTANIPSRDPKLLQRLIFVDVWIHKQAGVAWDWIPLKWSGGSINRSPDQAMPFEMIPLN